NSTPQTTRETEPPRRESVTHGKRETGTSSRWGASRAAGLFADVRLQRQIDGLAALGAAGHGLGKLHVLHTGCEIGQLDRPALANRIHEVGLDPPPALLVRRDCNLPQRRGLAGLVAVYPAGAADAIRD